MARNLELKARYASLEKARIAAQQLGAQFSETLLQEDTYFAVPRGRLKIRVLAPNVAELIFYERPEDSPARWSDYTKATILDAAGMRMLLEHAFGIRAIVRKRRDVFLFRNVRIHLDSVDFLGSFLEFEIMEGEEAESRRLLAELRGVFDIQDDTIVSSSYEDLILSMARDGSGSGGSEW